MNNLIRLKTQVSKDLINLGNAVANNSSTTFLCRMNSRTTVTIYRK